jgi:NAD+ kinase
MSVVGFIVHEGRDAAVDAAAALGAALRDDGVEVVRARDAEGTARPDLIVTIGGDGTFLRGAHEAAELDCPVLGVKVGRLGFLTEVEPADALGLIRDALAGRAVIEERLATIARADGGTAFVPQWGLNEIMVEKRARHRLIRLAVEVDGEYVTTFSADGVVVATPTGSTAYSFSARGPIVSPRHRCVLLTPVSPHMLFDRSLVLDPDESVRFVVCDDRSVVLTADGLELGNLAGGDAVSCTGGSHPARIVTLGLRDFHQILKAKFGLADR